MRRPRLLDLFCCEGGASTGYHRAGFDVVGVDLDMRALRRYPFESYQADALEFVKAHGHEFDAIAASPPCQAYSATRHTHQVTHPELVEPTRDALIATGLPYVIENVEGAPLRNPLRLCGSEFGLRAYDPSRGQVVALRRHRLFESNVFLLGAGGCSCNVDRAAGRIAGVYGGGSTSREAASIRRGGYTPGKDVGAALLRIDWMTRYGLAQSIPPVYTEHIGRQLIESLA
jgi:DNA (cytosine-5)-methyltransferase 1